MSVNVVKTLIQVFIIFFNLRSVLVFCLFDFSFFFFQFVRLLKRRQTPLLNSKVLKISFRYTEFYGEIFAIVSNWLTVRVFVQ